MKPGLNDQPRRGAWPNPLDTPLDRARRIAGMYRARLRALDTAACDELDDTVRAFGETWMLDKPDLVDPDRELTTAEAAAYARVSQDMIRHWARLKHPKDPGKPLLPRFGWRGRERTYIAAKVVEAAVLAKTERLAR
jgi:hypothetical protein